MKKPKIGHIYRLNLNIGENRYFGKNRFLVMDIKPEKIKYRVYFSNVKSGQVGSMELTEFNRNFVEETKNE